MRISGFDWDAVNLSKVRDHGLGPDEVEDLFATERPCVFQHPRNRRRWIALGVAPGGRFVLVVFERDSRTFRVRVVTAYEPTSKRWWRIYEKKSRKR